MRLKNKSRRMISFTLAHNTVCEDGGPCLCSKGEHRSRALNPRNGDVGVRVIDLQIAASVHLAPGETSEDLRASVKKLPDVATMLRRGELSAI